MKFCPECGSKLAQPPGRFCSECGTALATPEAVAAPPSSSVGSDAQSTNYTPTWGYNGVFNVESGMAAMATDIFPTCECTYTRWLGDAACKECGRSDDNFVSVLAGGGDGLYPVFVVGAEPDETLGAQVIFTRNGPDELMSGTGPFEWLMENARPMALIEWSASAVFMSEASAGYDVRDCFVTSEVDDGRYLVVAWAKEDPYVSPDPEMRPIALGLYAGAYRERIEVVLGYSTREADRAACLQMSRREGLTHMSHIQPEWGKALLFNFQDALDAGRPDVAQSFALQGALHGDEKCAELLEAFPRAATEDFYAVAEGFAWRGQRTAALEMWRQLAEDGDAGAMINLGNGLCDLDIAEAEEWTFRGLFAATEAEPLAIAINNLAFSILIPQRRFVEASLWLNVAIGADVPFQSNNARSNLGQIHFLRGDFDTAREFFEIIVRTQDGPVQEALDFLERIGTEAPGAAMPDAPREMMFSDAWQSIDVSRPAPMSGSDQFYYELSTAHGARIEDCQDLFDESDYAQAVFITSVTSSALQYVKAPIKRDIFIQAIRDVIRYRLVA